MTQEIFERLKPYEEKLYTAYYCQFVRLTEPNAKKELAKIYKEYTGEEGNIMNGCTRCVLNGIRLLAKPYFEMKKALAEMEAKKEVGSEPEPEFKVIANQTVAKPQPKKAVNKTKKTTKK